MQFFNAAKSLYADWFLFSMHSTILLRKVMENLVDIHRLTNAFF